MNIFLQAAETFVKQSLPHSTSAHTSNTSKMTVPLSVKSLPTASSQTGRQRPGKRMGVTTVNKALPLVIALQRHSMMTTMPETMGFLILGRETDLLRPCTCCYRLQRFTTVRYARSFTGVLCT